MRVCWQHFDVISIRTRIIKIIYNWYCTFTRSSRSTKQKYAHYDVYRKIYIKFAMLQNSIARLLDEIKKRHDICLVMNTTLRMWVFRTTRFTTSVRCVARLLLATCLIVFLIFQYAKHYRGWVVWILIIVLFSFAMLQFSNDNMFEGYFCFWILKG